MHSRYENHRAEGNGTARDLSGARELFADYPDLEEEDLRQALAFAASTMDGPIHICKDEDGMYIADCPSIPGCMSQGETEDAAKANIGDAIRQCLAVRAELGMPLTVQPTKSMF